MIPSFFGTSFTTYFGASFGQYLDSDILQKILLCLVGGLVLGCFHFGGLWFTLQKLCNAKSYGLIFIASFLLRSLVTLAGVFIVGNGEWMGMTACLGGILIMRQIFINRIKSPGVSQVKGSPT
ncbi:MAG: ATP synthase subunit I [Desulfobacterium sp.]|jgi:F1F0 ATPase subunit 2|nr:ATP synthase subunit I [Desulfobacterium sp.]